jgi:hypothetical protein
LFARVKAGRSELMVRLIVIADPQSANSSTGRAKVWSKFRRRRK